jgi:hypothetical protein
MTGGIHGALHIDMTRQSMQSFLLPLWLPAAMSVLHLESSMVMHLAAAICCISCVGGA